MVNFQLKEKKDLLVALDYLDENVEKKDVMCVKKRKKRARKLLKQQQSRKHKPIYCQVRIKIFKKKYEKSGNKA